MKNIQVIDGAANCTFSIFQATDEEFALLFPEARQDIQYAEDLLLLPKRDEIDAAAERIWQRPIRKQEAQGIHGTFFMSSSGTRSTIAKSGKTLSILTRSIRRSAGFSARTWDRWSWVPPHLTSPPSGGEEYEKT